MVVYTADEIKKQLENKNTGNLTKNHRPIIYHSSISIDNLTTQNIKEFDNEKIWNNKDYPNRPSFYCLTITK